MQKQRYRDIQVEKGGEREKSKERRERER